MGKHIATVKGKKLSQDEIWPIVLVCTDLNLKIEVTYDSRCGLFEVKANGVPYLSLPYIAPNHNYFDELGEFFRATVVMNNKIVLD